MGQAPRGDTYNKEGSGWPLIAGAGDFGDRHPVIQKFTTAASARLCEPGDLVLGIRASIGDKVLADSVYCLGRGVAGLRPRSALDNRYLWHWVSFGSHDLAQRGRGATFKQVNKSDLAGWEIPLPAIQEQRRISAVLDAADALCAKRRQALAKLDTLAQAVFVHMFGDGSEWPMGRLGDHLPTTSGGTPSRSRPDYFGGHIPWVKSGELSVELVTATEEAITDAALANSSAKLMPAGTVLLAMYGATVGEASVLGIEAATNQAVCCLSPTESMTGAYLLGLLQTRKNDLIRRAAGGAQPNISQTIIRGLEVPLAPVEAQAKYAERIAAIDNLRAVTRSSAAELDMLFASLQQRAFRGEL